MEQVPYWGPQAPRICAPTVLNSTKYEIQNGPPRFVTRCTVLEDIYLNVKNYFRGVLEFVVHMHCDS
jgi:hypothetical protein